MNALLEALNHPIDAPSIIANKRKLARLLKNDGNDRIHKKIAILGGSTTSDIKDILALFLMQYGIEPSFYESEYAKYWEDGVFPNPELDAFAPDLIFIHTTNRNFRFCIDPTISDDEARNTPKSEFQRFQTLWNSLERFQCPIIQNNMEPPSYRLYGNSDCWNVHGRSWQINQFNQLLAEYAETHPNFYIHDLSYTASCYGLDRWHDQQHWCLYKYAMSVSAIPYFSYSLSALIKAIYGKNKKALALDLDNTLWGGVIGDDGLEGISIGKENAEAEAYTAVQEYLMELSQMGILLTINSKNERENALLGLSHSSGVLKENHFVTICANWNPKSENLKEIASSLNLLEESFVFVDDNPAERAIVKGQTSASVPEISTPDLTIQAIDRGMYFEPITLSADDLARNQMYMENAKRNAREASFSDYDSYLESLEMTAHITDFQPIQISRITQLTNKSNQFNLTTKRMTESEVKALCQREDVIRLVGTLEDCFGDNGIVSIVYATQTGEQADIDLWLMSCRVLRRGMEYAMLETLITECQKRGIKILRGHYYPTKKNKMVEHLYEDFGFNCISVTEQESLFELSLEQRLPIQHKILIKGDES